MELKREIQARGGNFEVSGIEMTLNETTQDLSVRREGKMSQG